MSIDKDIASLERNSYIESTQTANQAGRVVVNSDGSPIGTSATAASSGALSNSSSVAYVASQAVKATPGRLYGFSVYNSKGSAQFIQLHNATSLPSNTAVPVAVYTVPAQSNISIDFGNLGRYFSIGIVIANSSTGPTLTNGSADVFIDAQYV